MTKAQLKREYQDMVRMTEQGVTNGYIGTKDGRNTMPEVPTAGRLYLNLEDHEPVRLDTGLPPTREIVANSGANSEGLAKLMAAKLRPVNMKAESFLKDTPHLLRMLQTLNDDGGVGPGVIPFSMDIVAMYPSVPINQAVKVMARALQREGMAMKELKWTKRVVEAVMKGNTFEFNGKLYNQITGAAIDSPLAGDFCGIFVSEIEEKGLKRYVDFINEAERLVGKGEIIFFKRFVDEFLGLFRGTAEQLKYLLMAMNSVHEAIQYTMEQDLTSNSVVFMDLVIQVDEEGFINTDIHTKLNKKNTLLLPSSAHPKRTGKRIIYSQGLRLVRICNKRLVLEKRMTEMKQRFLDRDYPEILIDKVLAKAKMRSRMDLLKETVRSKVERRHKLIVTFDERITPRLGEVLKDNWTDMCDTDLRMKKIFPDPPVLVTKRRKNISSLITRAKVYKIREGITTRSKEREELAGFQMCRAGKEKRECVMCPYTLNGIGDKGQRLITKVDMGNLGKEIIIRERVSCDTKGILYILRDVVDGSMYLGQSGQKMRERFRKHKADILAKDKSHPMAKHLMKVGRGLESVQVIVFKKVNGNTAIRKEMEKSFINKYDLVRKGLNKVL